ncbi:MAG: radical SAM protein [Bacteroidota bacterium]|nr:radical SAM protein [Bacteroidota bacterium]
MPDLREIRSLRPARNRVDPLRPYHFLHEQEIDPYGQLKKVNTLFLTGRECAFTCLMCDLWKNTLTESSPPGSVLTQMDYALSRLPQAEVIKLYNSSNFFDPRAVPPGDYPGIIDRARSYERIIVENHPRLSGPSCVEFSKLCPGKLEIAMGLESIHPEVLPRLNKQLTQEDFKRAATYLLENGIELRTFILLNPPYLTDAEENREWTLKAVEFAFDCGVSCCSIIATRPGNGIMELLQKKGAYLPPTLDLLESVFEQSLALHGGRVLVDTWDLGFMADCPRCTPQRIDRLNQMNLTQKFQARISCDCH